MKPKYAILLTIALVMSLGTIVTAQENTNDLDTASEQNECEVILNEIDQKITQFQTANPKHLEKYNILWIKLATIAATAETLGYDTTLLSENLEDLDLLTEEFSENYDLFITNLEDTKDYACSTNEKAYASSLIDAKEALDDVRLSAKTITDFYEEEIKPNILNLEAQDE